MQLDGWAESDVPSSQTTWRTGHALGAAVGIFGQGQEVVFTLNRDRVGSSVSQSWLVIRRSALYGGSR
jgi:hypothetical protein